MKANELRIGNILNLKGEDKFYNINGQHIASWESPMMGEEYAAKDFLEPTPLTEEWLVKCGAKLNHQQWHEIEIKPFGKIVVKISGHKVISELVQNRGYSLTYPPLDYVYQLQNLYFALTGEELLIKTT